MVIVVKSGFILFIKNYQFSLQINTLKREREREREKRVDSLNPAAVEGNYPKNKEPKRSWSCVPEEKKISSCRTAVAGNVSPRSFLSLSLSLKRVYCKGN